MKKTGSKRQRKKKARESINDGKQPSEHAAYNFDNLWFIIYKINCSLIFMLHIIV